MVRLQSKENRGSGVEKNTRVMWMIDCEERRCKRGYIALMIYNDVSREEEEEKKREKKRNRRINPVLYTMCGVGIGGGEGCWTWTMCVRERGSRGVDVGVFLGRWASTCEAGQWQWWVWLSQCSFTTVKEKIEREKSKNNKK